MMIIKMMTMIIASYHQCFSHYVYVPSHHSRLPLRPDLPLCPFRAPSKYVVQFDPIADLSLPFHGLRVRLLLFTHRACVVAIAV